MEFVRQYVKYAIRQAEKQPVSPGRVPSVVRKKFCNTVFFLLTIYFIFYMIISMWPMLIAFLVLYFHNTGLRVNTYAVINILVKVWMFAYNLSFTILSEIMRFAMSF